MYLITSSQFLILHSLSCIKYLAALSSHTPFHLSRINLKSIGRDVYTKLYQTDKTIDEIAEKRNAIKASLFGIIGAIPMAETEFVDPILADPITKEPLKISSEGVILGGQPSSFMKFTLKSDGSTYGGRSDTYFNLLRDESIESKAEAESEESNEYTVSDALQSLRVFIPPPVRSVLTSSGFLSTDDYIPMRDLFTSPQVSFAYERGWRQGFASAGFPGADEEAGLVQTYFDDVSPTVVVDMSCASGLFTRRLTKSGKYQRVIGCDYSDSMLKEARARITADPQLSNQSTALDLVRCDVGDIPMVSESIDALHAGAAMHCWPDLDAALSEIYRVLKPGGRYFASTFLSQYFSGVQALDGNGNVNQQAFQYFESKDVLKEMVVKAGFDEEKVSVEILGRACAIIRAEK